MEYDNYALMISVVLRSVVILSVCVCAQKFG